MPISVLSLSGRAGGIISFLAEIFFCIYSSEKFLESEYLLTASMITTANKYCESYTQPIILMKNSFYKNVLWTSDQSEIFFYFICYIFIFLFLYLLIYFLSIINAKTDTTPLYFMLYVCILYIYITEASWLYKQFQQKYSTMHNAFFHFTILTKINFNVTINRSESIPNLRDQANWFIHGEEHLDHSILLLIGSLNIYNFFF